MSNLAYYAETSSGICLCSFLRLKMFLNDLGQPLILDSKKTYGPYEQVKIILEPIFIIKKIYL